MKVCCICKISKLLINYHKDKTSKDGHSYQCKSCAIEKAKKHYLNDIEHSKKIRNNWKQKNKDLSIKLCKDWREKNKEKIKINHKNTEEKLRENLSYSYVKRLLTQHNGFSKEHITNELIEFKRIQIKLKRLLNGELV